MNRRLFLASAAALPASGVAARAASADTITFYDSRYAPARRFAAEHARNGAATCAVQPDALAVWRALRPTLSRDTRLSGMTTHSDFVVLHDCARELGLALVDVAEHNGRRSGAATLYAWSFAPPDQGSTTPTRAR